MTTEKFVQFIKSFYQKEFNIKLDDRLFQEWIYSEGLPATCPVPNAARFKLVDTAIEKWKSNGKIDAAQTKTWSTHEWLYFLKGLPRDLTKQQLEALDAVGKFTVSGNSEILTEWLVLTIHNRYAASDQKLEDFLVNTGRRKFLTPLYTELIKTPEGKQRALEIYAKARPNYHFVATNTIDKMLR